MFVQNNSTSLLDTILMFLMVCLAILTIALRIFGFSMFMPVSILLIAVVGGLSVVRNRWNVGICALTMIFAVILLPV